jgi:UDP-N-acetylmuramoyl-tripeptide--D-alanyl-D-alanine ligase
MRNLLAGLLGWQVRRLQSKNHFKVVAVAGSIGKTSTKLAIAKVLSQKYRVQYQDGNYNDLLSVPLVYFGHHFEENDRLPFLYNPFSWLALLIKNEAVIRRHYPYEIVVIELGPDGPGQMSPFKRYVKAEIGVLTAIAPEHMEFFGDMEAVAKEELVLAELSKKLLYNADLVNEKYLSKIKIPARSYDLKQAKAYKLDLISDPQRYTASAAISVAEELGMTAAHIKAGLGEVKPMSGRMQILKGINHSTIIDDSYNASPQAVKSALNALYEIDAPQKIAVLGNMNELGAYSEKAHKEVGAYCDPKKLDLILTLGPDANQFLAPAAEARDCKVQTFDDPYTVGEYLQSIIRDGAAILIKGSQNKVYAEEAIKPILANRQDAGKLVRQSPQWLRIKRQNFNL